jgi:D-glycero-alpha-D-manno-heptose-7-phosphate kinase
MSVIFTRSPLRLSLGGGGTDLPSYYKRRGGFLIAGGVDKYIYILAHTVFQKRYRMKYSEFEEVDSADQIRHPILREALVKHWRGNPLEIASIADVPAGTGMGSSGAYTVAVLKALALAGRRPTTPARLAEDAAEIEIDILGEPVGKQDSYVAAHGGICAYVFHQDGSVDVEPLDLSAETLATMNSNFLLFFTGEVRSASGTLGDQVARTESDDETMLANLDRTKKIGLESRALLEGGELEHYGSLMHEHWENKKRRSPGMSTERVDELYMLAQRSGALGGKLVGAGGGGFLLVYTPRPDDTRLAMSRAGADELRFSFEFNGCTGSEFP